MSRKQKENIVFFIVIVLLLISYNVYKDTGRQSTDPYWYRSIQLKELTNQTIKDYRITKIEKIYWAKISSDIFENTLDARDIKVKSKNGDGYLLLVKGSFSKSLLSNVPSSAEWVADYLIFNKVGTEDERISITFDQAEFEPFFQTLTKFIDLTEYSLKDTDKRLMNLDNP